MNLGTYYGYFLIMGLLCSCNPTEPEPNNSKGWLYYLDGNDTLKAISIDDQRTVSLKHLPSAHGQHHISPDGEKFLFGAQEKVNDSTYNYSIHILDLSSNINLTVGKGYGGVWSHSGNKFAVFMDDSIWVYEYPSLKRKNSFTYKNYWRLCSIDWTPSDKFIVAFAYDLKPDEEGDISALKNTKILLLSSDSLKIIREEKMDSMFTKRFVSVKDNEFFCCVQCMKCNLKKETWHVLKIDLSKKTPFQHLPLFVDYTIEDIAISEDPKHLMYLDSKNKSVVLAPLSNLDSNKILIPSSAVSLVGWSKMCYKCK